MDFVVDGVNGNEVIIIISNINFFNEINHG